MRLLPAKQEAFFGWRLRLISTPEGIPISFDLVPGGEASTAATGWGAELWWALAGWLTAQGVSVTLADCGRPNGSYRPATKAVVVHERLRRTDGATKTLAHEAAHHVAAHHALVPT